MHAVRLCGFMDAPQEPVQQASPHCPTCGANPRQTSRLRDHAAYACGATDTSLALGHHPTTPRDLALYRQALRAANRSDPMVPGT